jgi:methylmalonyl-CoA/ethylmalonyl-CoA epimerase
MLDRSAQNLLYGSRDLEGGVDMESGKSSIGPLVLNHVGVVVKDIKKTAEFLSSFCGIAHWQFWDTTVRKEELIVGEPFRLKSAQARLGPIVLELLQPVEGQTVWAEFLETKGEGLHHIAFRVSDFDKTLSKLKRLGIGVLAGSSSDQEGQPWVYIDTGTAPGGIVLELKPPDKQQQEL